MSYPVADLRRYLTGRWMLTRILTDKRAGVSGSFLGWASFEERPGEKDGRLDYHERGQMLFGDYRGISFRRYRYSFPDPGRAEVHFTDGRLFHPLDLSTGTTDAVHHCGRDVYSGRFDVGGDGLWDSQWHIGGPRKDLVIVNRYVRSCG